MLGYIVRRVLLIIPTMLVISIVVFLVIQLPPGDYANTLMSTMQDSGMDNFGVEALRKQYGLDQPIYIQYGRWVWGMVSAGDFGYSFKWSVPVSQLIWDRLGMSVLVSLSALVLTWAIALPIGIYAAARKYTTGDYLASFIGFAGLAVPNFLLALLIMYGAFSIFGMSVGGLFSADYVNAPWSFARVGDLLSHIWIPALVVGLGGTASLIRIMRANLLDELGKPYVVTARAKGLGETRLLLKYPVRLALNPFISSLAWVLPGLVSGETIVSIVLSLPTTGPLLLDALIAQDMYLAGSIILMLSVLTIVGTLISDILLAVLDPRVRYA
jgi:peptide/nickel transport system permease protein